ncbi:hypothetical protein FB45DRAFT_1066308 [Roridomyces roridus]|uniref:Uncharacterized protein n=1 Tax=Roridomyces roridus TaxID=1738132 RepID=A0AAD7B4X0_9AGAR|nr:hypothetical protein FB45DRAFT_1066308 [Roridomyces roridus]
MAVHACKLHRRWSSSAPRPASVHTFDLVGGRVLELFPIEGKHMVITVSFPRIACWDTNSGQCLGFWDRSDGVSDAWQTVSSPFTTAGMTHIGFVSQSFTRMKFTIVAVDHRNPSTVNVSPTFSKAWRLPAGRMTSYVLANAHTIGVVMSHDHPDDPVPHSSRSLVFCRIGDGLLRHFSFSVDTSINSLDGLAVDDDFFMIGQSFTSMSPIISLRSTPSGNFRREKRGFLRLSEPANEQPASPLRCSCTINAMWSTIIASHIALKAYLGRPVKVRL